MPTRTRTWRRHKAQAQTSSHNSKHSLASSTQLRLISGHTQRLRCHTAVCASDPSFRLPARAIRLRKSTAGPPAHPAKAAPLGMIRPRLNLQHTSPHDQRHSVSLLPLPAATTLLRLPFLQPVPGTLPRHFAPTQIILQPTAFNSLAHPSPLPLHLLAATLSVPRIHRTEDVVLEAAVMANTPTAREAQMMAAHRPAGGAIAY